MDVERGFTSDEAPEADAVEQRQPADFGDEAGLDTTYLGTADRDANEADLVEQAFSVPEDEWDDER